MLIIGAGEVGHTLAAKISRHPEFRIKLVGFLDDGEPRGNGDTGPPLPVIGVFGDLDRIVAEQQIDRVIVAFSRARHNDFLRVVRACADSGVKVNIVPRLFEVVSSRALVDDVEGIPLLDVAHIELSRFNMAVKRVFDLVGRRRVLRPRAAGARHRRAGDQARLARPRLLSAGAHGSRRQTVLHVQVPLHVRRRRQAARRAWPKSRTTTTARCSRSTTTRASRASAAGLRRWSIDELPQIINVMKGDMSLVGPRPLWVEEAKQCRGWTQKRLDITPGITGLWQVLGRSDIPFDEMVKLDYMYVTGWSLSWDVKLLLQTVPAVVRSAARTDLWRRSAVQASCP